MSDGAQADGDERRCPECGARLGVYGCCEELFHLALAMEWETPEAGAAHHLLVGTYMLQHPSGFTAEGRAAYRALVETVVDEGLSPEQLRERNRRRFDQGERDFAFKAKEPSAPVLREWRTTIADVVAGPPEDLPARVWAWARSAREELREG